MQFALFVTGMLWLLASRVAADHGAQALVNRLNLPDWEPLLGECGFLLLLLGGFATLSWIATRVGGVRRTNALPKRATAVREWGLGAALGWGLLLAAVLPMMLAGELHPQFWWEPRAWGLAVLALLTLAVGTLGLEVGFRGFVFRKLIAAIGPTLATLLLSLIYALVASFRPNSTGMSFVVTFVTGIVFSMAYLRTHALWLGWGLHFGWDAVMGVLLGLRVGGLGIFSSVVSSDTSGPSWLSGGAYGPEGAVWAGLVLLAGLAVLYRATRDYAWEYTHAPIVAAGYPMDVAPPQAHVEMEQAAAAQPAPLVQILGTTSTNASTMPVIEEHLRRTPEAGE